MKEDVHFNQVLEIIKPYVRDEVAFKEANFSTRFIQDLKVNSARLVDIILELEDKYNIAISDDEAEKMETIGIAAELLKSKGV